MNRSLASSGNGRQPVTPITPTSTTRNSASNIDAKVQAIALEFGLPISIRNELSSPSERHRTSSLAIEECISHIRFLFFRNRKALDDVLEQLRADRKNGFVNGNVLTHLLDLFRDPVQLEKAKFTIFNLDKKTPLPEHATFLNETRSEAAPRTQNISTPSGKKNVNAKLAKSSRPLRQSKLTWPSNKNGDQLKLTDEKQVNARPTTLKRSSEEVSPQRAKQARLGVLKGTGSSNNAPKSSRVSFDTVSTLPSATTSFNMSTASASFATTAATSFIEQADNDWQSSANAYGDLDDHEADELMTSFDQSVSFETKLRMSTVDERNSAHQSTRYDLRSNTDVSSPSYVESSRAKLPALQPFVREKQTATPSEPWYVRDLPFHGLFADQLPDVLSTLTLPKRWEYVRIADFLQMDLNALALRLKPDTSNLDDILSKSRQEKRNFERSPSELLGDLIVHGSNDDVLYRARLHYTKKPGTPGQLLFRLQLQSLELDQTSRLERKFGSNRFLSLEVPGKQGQDKEVQQTIDQRFRQWLCCEKQFLGFTWRPFYVQAIKTKAKGRDTAGRQRVMLFATHGPGLEAIGVNQLLDHIIPLGTNLQQPFCKAFARIELSLSRTMPTVKFDYSQVHFIRDTVADGFPENTTFDDPSFIFPTGHNPFNPLVMNDGCSQISVGAAKLICEVLQITGMRPVSFQGRINGCKGMWSISAPYDSTDAHHQAVWIQISESQRKVVPRPTDCDRSVCEPGRWTFDLVKYSTSPKASNLYLDFMPILEDRHVPREVICNIVESQLEMEFQGLFEALDDPVQLRRWIHSQGAAFEEESRRSGTVWSSSFPSRDTEQVILLLESGFEPRTCSQLSASLQKFIDAWTRQLREKLNVRLPMSTSLLGIADPTGCLRPGEVFLGFSETFRDEVNGQSWSSVIGEVLVARHPALRHSDIQKVKAVYKEELSHLRDVIVFPSRGCRPLADKLQGGDYDGDTFWVCWDTKLTKPFQNAPAPPADGQAQLEEFAIEADRRTLEEILGPKMDINAWLSASFGFKLQEDMLGQVTNLHKRLAYKEGVVSPDVTALADLHDLIIDSAKNGYTFNKEAFAAFKKKRGIREPPMPAFERHLKDFSATDEDKELGPRYNPAHIIDKVLFEVVDPNIRQMQKKLKTLLKPSDAPDSDLTNYYHAHAGHPQSLPEALLKDLEERLTGVIDCWNDTTGKPMDLTSEQDAQAYKLCEAKCHALYRDIAPSPKAGADAHLVSSLTTRRLPSEPTSWDLLKASTFYHLRHGSSSRGRYPQRPKSPALVFRIAGRELCYIKAMSRPGGARPREIVQELYAVYKPGRDKKAGITKAKVKGKYVQPLEDEGVVGESFIEAGSSSTEDEFFDAVDEEWDFV